jgi:23S rRNA (adenine1618-N6)-methyltransferase
LLDEAEHILINQQCQRGITGEEHRQSAAIRHPCNNHPPSGTFRLPHFAVGNTIARMAKRDQSLQMTFTRDKPSDKVPRTKKGLHPRSRHRDLYDFKQLMKSCPDLAPFVSPNSHGTDSIDFANTDAVRTLNRAILKHFYGVSNWDIPANYLCPPVPGRVDYIHHVADLLASCNGSVIPRGKSIRVLDIGVGASCIYPIIGHIEYGWSFLGSDIDPIALASAKRIVQSNDQLSRAIQFRLQASPLNIFRGIVTGGDMFDLSICNPPFHASLNEAREGTRRKWKNLGKETAAGKETGKAPAQNFGGQEIELCCPGGEAAFVRRMITESSMIPSKCLWFSTLISKASNLPGIYHALKKAGTLNIRTIEMAQGQKKSRIVAWTYFSKRQQKDWYARS